MVNQIELGGKKEVEINIFYMSVIVYRILLQISVSVNLFQSQVLLRSPSFLMISNLFNLKYLTLIHILITSELKQKWILFQFYCTLIDLS